LVSSPQAGTRLGSRLDLSPIHLVLDLFQALKRARGLGAGKRGDLMFVQHMLFQAL